jgi:hypothetical protein
MMPVGFVATMDAKDGDGGGDNYWETDALNKFRVRID